MQHVGCVVLAVLSLIGCSARNEQDIKNQPITIDKTQIDLKRSDPYFYSPNDKTNWQCILLAKTGPEDDEVRWKRLKAMQGQSIRITDGQEILATGTITALTEMQGNYQGPVIGFPSLEVAESFYRKLGFHPRQ